MGLTYPEAPGLDDPYSPPEKAVLGVIAHLSEAHGSAPTLDGILAETPVGDRHLVGMSLERLVRRGRVEALRPGGGVLRFREARPASRAVAG